MATPADIRTKFSPATDIVNHANQWQFYQEGLISRGRLLPPSIHSRKLRENSVMKKWYENPNNSATILDEDELLTDLKRAQDQFTRIKGDRPPIFESSLGVKIFDIVKLSQYDTTPITYASNFGERFSNMFQYITDREDNHSMLQLVRDATNHNMHSVIATKFIPYMTSPTEYGGDVFFRHQVGDDDHKSSCTFDLLRHKTDPSQTIVIQPFKQSNYARYFNGLRSAERSKANLATIVVKVYNTFRLRFIALRDIQKGEHLFYYYGDAYPDTDFYEMEKITKGIKWEVV
jgi:hypothetical protein